MKILVIGSGGREHALAWKLAGDGARPTLYCAPGNAGTATVATSVPIAADDLDGLTRWARAERPDLTVVGPEAPLCAGLADRFAAEGLRVFGPVQAAAALEGSKAFCKDVMAAAKVPTADYAVFEDHARAVAYARSLGAPVVVKADGLAAGKGVFVCSSLAEAEEALRATMVEKVFGEAGARVVVEEFLTGEEASIMALVDGQTIVPLASSQDHKRAFNNDEGPNTGGMGAYSPAPVVTEAMWPAIREQVFERTLTELRRRGIVYRGVLYAGLMIGPQGPKVLEFNCRFGDPETQAVLPRLDGDFLPALLACADGTLRPDMVRWRSQACVCVVMASGGYPGAYVKGRTVSGLEQAAELPDVTVFHAGTDPGPDGRPVTSGGRVLGVTALGDGIAQAAWQAYRAVSRISFDQAQYRTDIAARALRREGATGGECA
jgi:phosphoribosylamine---glycine ligase